MFEVRMFHDDCTISKKKVGLGVFYWRQLQKNKVVLTYSGSLIFLDLNIERRNAFVYRHGIVVVTADRFRETGMGLSMNVHDPEGSVEDIWIVPTSLFVEGYVKDPMYGHDY